MSSELDVEKPALSEPKTWEILAAVGMALAFVASTRIPFARTGPIEADEWMFVEQMDSTWLPAHHTLFQTAGRAIGMLVGGHYRGLVALDMLVSALALASLWWWLRALVRPSTAAACTLVVGVSPLFWSLGEMAANYTVIPLVGAFLLGVAYRGLRSPKPWHPYASAALLALGTGYREDIGMFLLPLFGVIVWQHRWKRAVGALTLFTVMNLAWLLPMLWAVGGWGVFRKQSADFAHSAGYLNSYWNLGLVDGPVRYAVKMGLAFACTIGPGLLFVPRGMLRLVALPDGKMLAGLLALAVAPALGYHLLINFGSAGYGFHHLPALASLLALGVGRSAPEGVNIRWEGRTAPRLAGLAGLMAAAFLFYPADIDRPGWRGDLDLTAGRYTRAGLHADLTSRTAATWRTSNSVRSARPRAN
jgi:Dolichyl-phosphate-mannose-protein mannosyltransferase